MDEGRLLLVGSWSPRLPEVDLPEAVIRRDYVPEDELWALLAACDVVVSLRHPTMGETSAAAVRALSLGKPLVVSDVGWFSELPDDVAIRVPVDEREVETLATALEKLASDDAAREAMGAAARDLVEREHSLPHVADLYAAALEEAAGGGAVREVLLKDIAQAAAEIGIEAADPELGEVSARLDEVGLGG